MTSGRRQTRSSTRPISQVLGVSKNIYRGDLPYVARRSERKRRPDYEDDLAYGRAAKRGVTTTTYHVENRKALSALFSSREASTQSGSGSAQEPIDLAVKPTDDSTPPEQEQNEYLDLPLEVRLSFAIT